MAKSSIRVGGELQRLTLDQLEPDMENPRLPPRVQRSGLPAEQLYPYLERAYDVLSIAQSIARHGYFEAEPLIAVPMKNAYAGRRPTAADRDRFVVVEGNRRLTALKALTDRNLAAQMKAPGWKRLPPPSEVPLPETLPVLVVPDRRHAAPVLGFRHITRAAPWEPYSQAKYIADLIDDQDRAFDEIASLLSRPEPEVRSYYRNYWLREQMEELGLDDLDRVDDGFGTFTRAMQNPGLRNHIGAPAPRDVDPEYLPLPADSSDVVEELLTWMYGVPNPPRTREARRVREGQKMKESRDITRLGQAVSDPRSLARLRSGASLAEALEVLGDADADLVAALRLAQRAIERAVEAGRADDDLEELQRQIEAAADARSGD